MKGKIKFVVSDIMDLPADYAVDCDMTYTDPPWGQGLVKMFETLAFKDAGVERPGNLIVNILARLFSLSPIGKPIFVEWSVKDAMMVRGIGQDHGHVCKHMDVVTQTNGKLATVVSFNTEMTIDYPKRGYEFMFAALDYHKPKCVFDPFAGHGQHARRIINRGIDVVAAEFNPARARKLQDHFGL